MTIRRTSKIMLALLLLALLLGAAWLAGAKAAAFPETSQKASTALSVQNTSHALFTGPPSASFATLMYMAYR